MWGTLSGKGQVCSFQLLLGIASAVLLGSESRGTHEHYLPVFYRERGREKRKLGVVVRDITVGVGSRKQYIQFGKFPGSTC
jgi:hypothetical protein